MSLLRIKSISLFVRDRSLLLRMHLVRNEIICRRIEQADNERGHAISRIHILVLVSNVLVNRSG